MENDLRKNPRFITTEGVAARIHVGERIIDGLILNFSSTGFAVVVDEDIGKPGHDRIEVVFNTGTKQEKIRLSAMITNKKAFEQARLRVGCHITSMNDHSREYFSFLTSILGKQGFLKSMATKPKKVIERGNDA